MSEVEDTISEITKSYNSKLRFPILVQTLLFSQQAGDADNARRTEEAAERADIAAENARTLDFRSLVLNNADSADALRTAAYGSCPINYEVSIRVTVGMGYGNDRRKEYLR